MRRNNFGGGLLPREGRSNINDRDHHCSIDSSDRHACVLGFEDMREKIINTHTHTHKNIYTYL